ncbi:MAG: MaoC family dehydratase N-terminal domain-containing protein, partial [Pigmentiphaga sp.]
MTTHRSDVPPATAGTPASAGDPSAWVGRTETVADRLDGHLAARVAVTLDVERPGNGQPLPPLWHWAFFQNPLPAAGLGDDGHPARGGFLPPADGRNRMWAGGEVEFRQALRVGVDAERQTTIETVQEKSGTTGSLLFVTLRHEYVQAGELAIREWQNIVYRAPSPPKTSHEGEVPAAQWAMPVEPTPTLLFRYSAVTFNGHRIHYDHPYATEVEGYAGLVVHGPLLATLAVLAFCRANPTAVPRRLRYRGLRPVVVPQAFDVAGRIVAPGKAELWSANAQGMALRAELEFD